MVEYFLAYCGCLAMQSHPINWVSSHRHHHGATVAWHCLASSSTMGKSRESHPSGSSIRDLFFRGFR